MWRFLLLLGIASFLAGCGGASTASPTSTTDPRTAAAAVGLDPRVLFLKAFSQNGVWAMTQERLSITNDGGERWHDVTPDQLRGQYLGVGAAFFARDGSSAWMGNFPTPGPRPAKTTLTLFRTTDGGKTWVLNDVSLDVPSWEQLSGGSIFFLDDAHGWLTARFATNTAYSRGLLYRTTDGGASWIKVSAPMGEPITFATPLDGWMAGGPGGSHLYATHDGGVTWDVQQVPQQPVDKPWSVTVATPHFFDTMHGVLPVQIEPSTGTSSLFYYVTDDGGRTWTQSGAPVTIKSLGEFFAGGLSRAAFADRDNWFFLTDASYTTHDGGQTWTTTATDPYNALLIDFASPQDGWAYYSNSGCRKFKADCYQEPHLIATHDGGSSWKEVAVP